MKCTFALIGLCALFGILQVTVPGFTEALLLTPAAWSEPWRFVTAVFLHGDIAHFFYNMLALFFFGLVLERDVGSKRFVLVYGLAGLGANLLSVFFYPASLGASGAIFGLIGALVVMRPGMMVDAFGIPLPMVVAGLLWAVIDIVGVFAPSGTANLAHLMGMGVGIVFGVFYRPFVARIARRPVIVDERSMRAWEDASL
jgi:membrane associated rhomboid family serine protease